MSSDRPFHKDGVSRRDFLFVAAVGSGAVIGAGFASTPALASNKIPQKAVGYQTTPKGELRCDNCALWQGPSSRLLREI